MSPGERVDEILRLIDETLDGEGSTSAERELVPSANDAQRCESGPETPRGSWGVFYLRPRT